MKKIVTLLLLLLLSFLCTTESRRDSDARIPASTIAEEQPVSPVLPLSLRTVRAVLPSGTRARLSPLQQHLSICGGETSVTVVDDDGSAFLPLLVRCDSGPLKGTETWMPIDSIVAVSKEAINGPTEDDNASIKVNKRSKSSRLLSKFDDQQEEIELHKVSEKNYERIPFGENLTFYFLISTLCVCIFIAPKL